MLNPIESPREELVGNDLEVLPKELKITNQHVVQDNLNEVTQCDEAYDKFADQNLKVLQPHDEPIQEEDILHVMDVVNDEVLASQIKHEGIVINVLTRDMIFVQHVDFIISKEKVCVMLELKKLLAKDQAYFIHSQKSSSSFTIIWCEHVIRGAIANMKNLKIRGRIFMKKRGYDSRKNHQKRWDNET
ncbi:hypothetical protein Scep_019434 [Stephania cephalantha]|uniref:Uncharacterized protein n=1 Tax=Stephania cephalantha TaxID=152367 RepID=A0AAP0IB63_9MAGN